MLLVSCMNTVCNIDFGDSLNSVLTKVLSFDATISRKETMRLRYWLEFYFLTKIFAIYAMISGDRSLVQLMVGYYSFLKCLPWIFRSKIDWEISLWSSTASFIFSVLLCHVCRKKGIDLGFGLAQRLFFILTFVLYDRDFYEKTS